MNKIVIFFMNIRFIGDWFWSIKIFVYCIIDKKDPW